MAEKRQRTERSENEMDSEGGGRLAFLNHNPRSRKDI